MNQVEPVPLGLGLQEGDDARIGAGVIDNMDPMTRIGLFHDRIEAASHLVEGVVNRDDDVERENLESPG